MYYLISLKKTAQKVGLFPSEIAEHRKKNNMLSSEKLITETDQLQVLQHLDENCMVYSVYYFFLLKRKKKKKNQLVNHNPLDWAICSL